MTETLIFTVEEHVALLTLNRPDRRNAFTSEMLDLWAEALTECQRRPDIRVVIVTGAGQAFCAGGDIEEMQQRLSSPPLEHKRFLESVHRIPLMLAAMDKPVIAAVNGAAMGAGMDMALACDIRFASTNARFAASYVKMALAPGDGGAYFLPRLVGTAKALELLWTGDIIEAGKAEQLLQYPQTDRKKEESSTIPEPAVTAGSVYLGKPKMSSDSALALGIVNRVLPEEELMPYTREFAARLARGPEVAIRLTKRAVYESQAADLRTSLDLIASHMAVLMATDDHREAVQAFLEKRQPRFEGK